MLDFNVNDIANGMIASLSVESMKPFWKPLKEKVATYLRPKKAEPLLDCVESDPNEVQYFKLIADKLKDTGIEQDAELKDLINQILKSSENAYKPVTIVSSFNQNINSSINIVI